MLDGESRVRGFELGLAGEPVDGLSLNLGYTYLDSEITQSSTAGPAGRTLQQVPEHSIAAWARYDVCLLYTSDAADEEDSVDLGGCRIIKKKKKNKKKKKKKKKK